ncbi:MAG: hypothetical protein K8J09_06295 [Planctomycetes bacterium]|nr:hypothetical protein [Planctomycetota bacterium]MCC7396934.1 hypothetical protein [Planctomycetota bacterium]
MIESYRVIVVTPAGRERYLRVLAGHVLHSPLVDEWHLWQNTNDANDLNFLRELAALHPRVKLIAPPVEPPNGTATIGQFFRTAIDRDAIYVRMDDDLVWLEPDFFARLLQERLADREALFVFPLIVNNAVCSWLLQAAGKVKFSVRVHPWCLDMAAWNSGEFAEVLHRWFLTRIHDDRLDELRFEPVTASLSRVSINCISWFGVDLAPFGGVFPVTDEEEYASVTLPLELGLVNRITGRAICAHFAFYPQREHLDGTDILARYAALAPKVLLPEPALA